MYALVDCNSFFCSVEKAFHPGLKGKPVCVLSSNDGNIVALTPEAKALGLKRGDPVFKVKKIIEGGGVKLFSTNMILYASMSRRITSILRKSIEHVENYSIDESFCDLTGYEEHHNLETFMRGISRKILLWTDVPVSVGVASTKTLAKMGSHFAKKYKGYETVCMIDTEEKRRKALEIFPLADVWNIGRSTHARLLSLGIRTPLEFADRPEEYVRRNFTLPGIRTWMELNGIPCIDTSEKPRKDSICTSRSFGQMTGELQSLREAVATYAAGSANKLRGQHSVAGRVTVFLMTNRFRDDLPQYHNAGSYDFPVKTDDTLEITAAAFSVLEELYRPGFLFKKAGVILDDIEDISSVNLSLFDPIGNRSQRHELMRALDQMNCKYGRKMVRLSAESDGSGEWLTKCERRTPNYLTDISELLEVG